MRNRSIFATCLSVAVAAAGVATAQIPVNPKSGQSGAKGVINGAGSSFVNPVMSKWTRQFHQKTGTKINYQSTGSGAGIRQFIQKTVDFGATDGPMSDEQIKEAGGNVLHVPVVMGAVAIVYNLPGVKEQLKFTGPLVADIYMGKVKKWNDPAIKSLNPGAALPDKEIVVVHRSDGSGTTYIFADYLSKASPEWKEKIGTGTSLKWPTGVGGKGNEGVSAQVRQIANSIGYVEVVYALETKTPVGLLQNSEGEFVEPTVESVTAAAGDLKDVPEDLRMSITNAPGKEAYPISGLTWVIVRPQMDDKAKAKAIKDFLNYVLSDDAQNLAREVKYSRLPDALLEKARAKVAQIK